MRVPSAASTPLLHAALAAILGDQPLNEMQQAALPALLGGRRNLLIGAATGAGKTRLAEIALVEAALAGAAGLFLVPMRAIAGEKRADWRRFEAQGLRIYKTTGDDAAFDPVQAALAQIVVTTPERLESLIRSKRLGDLIERLRVVVIDEVHLVGDGRRGALLEALLTRLGRIMPKARLIAMSGTVPNIDQLAAWLDAEVFRSEWRPLPLEIRVESYKRLRNRHDDEALRTTMTALAVTRAIAEGGASIVFCGSRVAVERCALTLASEHTLPQQVSREMLARAEHTSLAEALAGGVGFHHAGLSRADRTLVEGLYREGTIRALVATSTVAAGVNLPASQVVVRDVRVGHDFLASSSMLQMCGRAGRVGLAESGEAIIITPERDLEKTTEILAGAPVESTLIEDLATPLCVEVALGLVRSEAEAAEWYGTTLHGRVAANLEALTVALRLLIDEGFVLVRPDGTLAATTLGHVTSSLMVRVATAMRLDRFLRGYATSHDVDAVEEDLLCAVCGRSDEWGDGVGSADAGDLAGRLGAYDPALANWAPLRVRALAAAVCLLSGISLEALDLPDSTAASQTARADLPRLLGFLSRRALERREPLPHVALAAEDLAACLVADLPLRGQLVRVTPQEGLRLETRGATLRLAGAPADVRCWVRLQAASDDYALTPSLSSGSAPLASLSSLGRPGSLISVTAQVVTRTSGAAGQWSHTTLRQQVQVPLRGADASQLNACRHDWRALQGYARPGRRTLRLARYLATGVLARAAASTKPAAAPRRPAVPDPSAPPCPVCKGPMTRRKSGRGEFFGCMSFPRCRGTHEAVARKG